MAKVHETETERNIRLYRAALPRMRSRVMAVLWLLIMSAVLMTGATFAWVTLSTAPEVTGVTTTVTANGALEIALSDADGEEPDASAVGDSSAAENQSVTAANLTWGNLVNLSDSSYGLDSLTLYPSRLNASSLRTSPLMAVNYGADGRVTALNSSLRYASWDTDYSQWSIIGTGSEYGVRAVGTVKNVSTGEADLSSLTAAAQTQLALAEDAYAAVVSSDSGYMASLVAIVGNRIDDKLNGETHDYASYTEDIYNMYVDLSAAAEQLGEAYAAVAEIYQYSIYGATEGVKNYTPYTLSDLLAKNEAEWEQMGITLTGWDDYLTLRASLEENSEEILAIHNKGLAGDSVSWSDIKPVLEDMFPYDDENTTYTYKNNYGNRVYHWEDFYGENSTVVIMFFLCVDSDSEEIQDGNTAYVTVGSGLLYDFEELISYSMSTDKLEAHFTYSMFYGWDLWIQMVVSTSSANDYVSDAIAAAPQDTEAGEGSTVAGETYGMAIDLWVRTNAEGVSYLTLDGAFVTDDEGNVSGYEGSNRVWEDYDTEIINGTSTTQGGGSCYVFYYDTAEDLPRVLNLLKGMKVVFFDTSTGTKLGTASFDTTSYYENSGGRVTVPLMVDDSGNNTYTQTTTTDGTTEETNTYYITALNQNEATRITALLYLDGTTLTNEQASASSDFTGTLNLQFKSTSSLISAADTTGDLYSEAVELSAELTETTVDNDGKVTAVVELTVGGTAEPTNVTARYARVVGTQALRQEQLYFTQSTEDSSVWTLEYTFTTPGTYVLSNVTLDGQEYELDEPIKVTVEGFSLNSVSWDYGSTTYTAFTADSSITVPIEIEFAAAYDGGESVRAAFVSSSGKYVYAALTSEDSGTTWTGSASITSSGTYTLKYFYIGSDVYDITSTMQKTLTAYMGLRASVRLTSSSFEEGQTGILYEDGETYTVNAFVTLTDNSGSTLRNVTGSGGAAEGSTMKLRYSKSGSATEYLETELTWSSSGGYYTGTFSVSTTGVYSFSAVTIGAESVTSTTSAPSLSVHYDEGTAPSYAENLTTATQTVIGGNGSFVVKLANSSSSWTVKAVVKDTDETQTDVTYTLEGVKGAVDSTGTARWTFAAVDDSGAALEGNFQMTELWIYSASTGDLYTTLDVSEEGITAKIVTTVYISTSYNNETVTNSITLTSGYAATSLASVTSETAESGNFYAVASLDLSALNVSLTDFEGEAVSGVAATSLEYTLDTDSTEDYGYTIVYNETEAPTMQTLAVTSASDGSCTFTAEELGFNLWGEYAATLTYTVNGEECTAELPSVEYATGDLPTFGNSSGTLSIKGASKGTNYLITNALVSAHEDVGEANYEFFSYETKNIPSSFATGQDADTDGDASDFIWNAYYYAVTGTTWTSKYNSGQQVVWDMTIGWMKPAGYVQMYAQNIYLSDDDAPAVWVTAEDGVVSDDGTIADGNILYGAATSYYLTRNFAYTEAISSDGLISQSTLDGKTIYGMGVGRVTGDEESTALWYSSSYTKAVYGAERTILGTYGTTTKPVYALAANSVTDPGYVTGELDYVISPTTGNPTTTRKCVVTDEITENTVYQTVMTDYEPVDIEEIYIQYNGVTYKVNTSNVFEINEYYNG